MFCDFISLLKSEKCRAMFAAGCILTAFMFTGCGGGSGSSSVENNSGSSLNYTGDIHSCIYNGTSCINSEFCAVTAATSGSSMGTVECKENLQNSRFSGELSACYFAGEACTSSSYCTIETQVNDIGTIKCNK